MIVEIHVGSELTAEQLAQREAYEQAAEVLRKSGFPHAHARGLVTSKSTDRVAVIYLEKP